jgi:hypothetical protein
LLRTVAYDFGEKDGPKRGEENYEQRIASSENTSAHSKTRSVTAQWNERNSGGPSGRNY